MAHGLNPKTMAMDSIAIAAQVGGSDRLPDGRMILVTPRFPNLAYIHGAFTCDPYEWFVFDEEWKAVSKEDAMAMVDYTPPFRIPEDVQWYEAYHLFPRKNEEGKTAGVYAYLHEDGRHWQPPHGLKHEDVRYSVDNYGVVEVDGCWLCFCGIPDICRATAAARARRGG